MHHRRRIPLNFLCNIRSSYLQGEVDEMIDSDASIGPGRSQMQMTAEAICMRLCWRLNNSVSNGDRY